MTKEALESLGALGTFKSLANLRQTWGRRQQANWIDLQFIYGEVGEVDPNHQNSPNNSRVKLLWSYCRHVVDMFIATEEQTMAKKSTNQHILHPGHRNGRGAVRSYVQAIPGYWSLAQMAIWRNFIYEMTNAVIFLHLYNHVTIHICIYICIYIYQ